MNRRFASEFEEVSDPNRLAQHPLVSILCLTYNQASYIRECVESVMLQERPFPIEMVIGEDCSTDGTRSICIELQRRYPDLVRLFLSRSNAGIGLNLINAFSACRGKYIAIVDGDDFWTDTRKLLKQVELMDGEPGLAGCFHNVMIKCEICGRDHGPYYPQSLRERFSQRDLIHGNPVPTCASFFRNHLFEGFPSWFVDEATCPCRDWVIHVLNATQGDYAYVDTVMGVYRLHGKGVWGGVCGAQESLPIRRMEGNLTTYQRFTEYFGRRYRSELRQLIATTCVHLALAYRKEADWPRFRSRILKGIRSRGHLLELLRIGAVVLIPSRRRRYERAAEVRRQRRLAAEQTP